MADTKLTRETVEMLRETFEDSAHPPSAQHIRSNFDNLAALCRHYLATEQDARAPDHVIAEWLDRHDLRMALPGQDARCAFEDAESWRAALTQKETPK